MARINFLEIFEKINRVEDILKQDPAKQYEIMVSKPLQVQIAKLVYEYKKGLEKKRDEL